MASQRVLLISIGGLLAESIWKDIQHWSDARTVTVQDEWSNDDWPLEIRQEVDAFVEKISSKGITLPILYHSEHVDCWSMGDIYQGALEKACPEYYREIHSDHYQ